MADAADASASDGVMIALLPITSDWCRQDLPHMTLVYAGLKSDLKPSDFNELAKDAASLAMLSTPIQLRVSGVSVFGPETDRVDVLNLQPTPELLAMRRAVEDWNASDYPWSPHCTIGPTGESNPYIPSALAFNRIMVGWGEDALTFWLKNGSNY